MGRRYQAVRPRGAPAWQEVGTTSDDVKRMQTAVATRTTQINDFVAKCASATDASGHTIHPGLFDTANYLAWEAEEAKCFTYANSDVPALFGLDQALADGNALLKELDTWAALWAKECPEQGQPPPAPSPAPPPKPGGGLPGLFGDIQGIEILLGIAALYFLTQGKS
jgi:hypothetical protein